MPVLRQKTQNINRPINVARIDTGASELWRTISANADQISNTAFKKLADKSVNEAIELGQAADNSKVTTINPVTGKPEALDAYDLNPRAQEAFSRIINQRFETSITNEIKLKAKELSSIENISPELYGEKMSQYLESMINNAQGGKYKNMIEETGTFYLASTKMNLTQTRLKEQRKKENDLFLIDMSNISQEFYETNNIEEKSLLLEDTLENINSRVESGTLKDVLQIKTIKDNLTENYYKSIIQDKANKDWKSQNDVSNFLSEINLGTYKDEDFDSADIPDYLRPTIAQFARTFGADMKFKAEQNQIELVDELGVDTANDFNEIIDQTQSIRGQTTIDLRGNKIPLSAEDKVIAYSRIIDNFVEQRQDVIRLQNKYPNFSKDILAQTRKDIWELILSDLKSSGVDDPNSLASAVGMINNAMSGDIILSNPARNIIQKLHDSGIIVGEDLGTASEYIKRGIDPKFTSKQAQIKQAAKEKEEHKNKMKFNVSLKDFSSGIASGKFDIESFFAQKEKLINKSRELNLNANVFAPKFIKLNQDFQEYQLTKFINALGTSATSDMLNGMVTYLRTSGQDNRGLLQFTTQRKNELGNVIQENLITAHLDDIMSFEQINHTELGAFVNSISTSVGQNETAEKARLKEREDDSNFLNYPTVETGKKLFDKKLDWMKPENWEQLSKTSSDKFQIALDKIMRGQQINPEEITAVLGLWSQFGEIVDPITGDILSNNLRQNGVINNSESAFLETLDDLVVSFGTDEAYRIVQRINGQTQEEKEKKYNTFLTSINQDKYSDTKKYQENSKDYISNVLNLPSDEFGISNNYRHHFEYMVLAGYSPDAINAKLNNIHNKEFVNTPEIIDTRFLDGKTNLHLNAAFNDPLVKNWATNNMEKELNHYGYTLKQPLEINVFDDVTIPSLTDKGTISASDITAFGRDDVNLATQTLLNVSREGIDIGVDFVLDKIFKKKRTANGLKSVVLVPVGSPMDGIDYFVHTYGGTDGKTLVPLQVNGPDNTLIMPVFNSNDIKNKYKETGLLTYQTGKNLDALTSSKIVQRQQRYNETVKYNRITAGFKIVDGEKLPKEIIKQIDFKDARFFAGKGDDKRGYFYINQVVGSGENFIHKPMVLTQSRKKVSNADARKILNQFHKDNPKEFERLLKYRLIHFNSPSNMIAKEFPTDLQ